MEKNRPKSAKASLDCGSDDEPLRGLERGFTSGTTVARQLSITLVYGLNWDAERGPELGSSWVVVEPQHWVTLACG